MVLKNRSKTDSQDTLDQNYFSLFWSASHPDTSFQVSSQMAFLGPVVQSVVSLTSSSMVISLTVLADSIHNILIFFAEKMWVAFAATDIFSAKNFSIFVYHLIKILTNRSLTTSLALNNWALFRSSKQIFKRHHGLSRWYHGGHLILTVFDLQVTLILPSKFQVNWPCGSGGVQNRFSGWPSVAAVLDFQSEWL